jgi:hypothetical protein
MERRRMKANGKKKSKASVCLLRMLSLNRPIIGYKHTCADKPKAFSQQFFLG